MVQNKISKIIGLNSGDPNGGGVFRYIYSTPKKLVFSLEREIYGSAETETNIFENNDILANQLINTNYFGEINDTSLNHKYFVIDTTTSYNEINNSGFVTVGSAWAPDNGEPIVFPFKTEALKETELIRVKIKNNSNSNRAGVTILNFNGDIWGISYNLRTAEPQTERLVQTIATTIAAGQTNVFYLMSTIKNFIPSTIDKSEYNFSLPIIMGFKVPNISYLVEIDLLTKKDLRRINFI